ncbi:hypothetical protein Tco_0511557 [Tanacetum coccineum]
MNGPEPIGLKLTGENLQSGVKEEDSITNIKNAVFDLSEMRASENAKSALAELGEMLEHEKANIETNMDRVMTPTECLMQDKCKLASGK